MADVGLDQGTRFLFTALIPVRFLDNRCIAQYTPSVPQQSDQGTELNWGKGHLSFAQRDAMLFQVDDQAICL